jgi:hypothetical protein
MPDPWTTRLIPARRRHASWVGGLVVFVAVLVAGSLPTIHGHSRAGVYDEECALAWLAGARPGAALPSIPTVAPLERAADATPSVLVLSLPDVHLASFDPRAPPVRPDLPARAH